MIKAPLVYWLFQLSAVVADFTGPEDEFQRMVARLHGDGGAVGLSALQGMGGVGKTSLAEKVPHTVRDHYPNAQPRPTPERSQPRAGG